MKILISIIFAALIHGCTTTEIRSSALSPPWVSGAPVTAEEVCAVGVAEPTFYRDDAKEYAAKSARKELARSVSIEIRSIMVDIATEKESSVDEATVMQASSWATSAVIKDSKVTDYWLDTGGTAGKKNMTYALCCMPRKFNRYDLERRLTRYNQPGASGLKEIKRKAGIIVERLQGEK